MWEIGCWEDGLPRAKRADVAGIPLKVLVSLLAEMSLLESQSHAATILCAISGAGLQFGALLALTTEHC